MIIMPAKKQRQIRQKEITKLKPVTPGTRELMILRCGRRTVKK